MNEAEVPELVGKIITCAKLMSTATEEQELLLSFDDGTSFAFSACSKVVAKGVLYRGGVGEPSTLREVELSS